MCAEGSSGGGGLLAQGLLGHSGPQEADEFAGDGDVGHGRALGALLGQDAVAVVEAHLGLPGARGDQRRELALLAFSRWRSVRRGGWR